MHQRLAPFTLLLGLLLAAPSIAQVPRLLDYQGRLADASGNPVADASYTLNFKIYDVASGGSALYTATKSVPTSKGLFAVVLGQDPDPPLALPFDKPYWLGISVNTDTEMAPRTQLTSAGYALNAEKLGGTLGGSGGSLTGPLSLPANGLVLGTNQLVAQGGNIGIGTALPGAKLQVVGEVRTTDPNNVTRLWGQGRPGVVYYGKDSATPGMGLCDSTQVSGVKFGLGDTVVSWSGAAAACPAGTWVCTLAERGTSACDTQAPTVIPIKCNGTADPSTLTPYGWVADADGVPHVVNGSYYGVGKIVPEGGGGSSFDSDCYKYPVWCCSN